MDRQEDDAHADWSPRDVEWDGLTLTARNSTGTDANVPTIEKYYIKGRGAASSGSSSGLASSSCRVPGCTSDLSRDLAYFRKYRICREHLKSPVLVVEGVPSRFCQQCSRFHHVKEFDGPQRTCRAMLERLRIKRNSSKAQPGARQSGRGKDTRPADASRRGASSSRSNSTGKDAEPHQDLASGQQPSPHRLAPTDSGEGGESAAVLGGAATTGSRRSGAATSAATAASLPGSNHLLDQPHALQLQHQHHQQQQALLQRWSRQNEPLPGDEEPRASSFQGAGPGPMAPPRGGGLADQQDLLQLFLSQDAALLPSRRLPLAEGGVFGGGGAGGEQPTNIRAAVASLTALHRDVRMTDYVADRHEAAGGAGGGTASTSAMGAPLYSEPFYGSGVANNLHLSRAAAAAQELIPRRQQPAQAPAVAGGGDVGPLHRADREIRLQLGPGSLEESLLLQLAIPRPQQHDARAAAAPQAPPSSAGNVLDLGEPAQARPMVLNLGSRVDLSLELQLQDIYREMAISDAAVAGQPFPAATAQQHQPRIQNQGPLLRTAGGHSGPPFTRSSAGLSHEPLLPLGHPQGLSRALASQAPLGSAHPPSLLGAQQQQLTATLAANPAGSLGPSLAVAAGVTLRPSSQQQCNALRAHSLTPMNELTAAMSMGARMGDGRNNMDLDGDHTILPMTRSGALAAVAPVGAAGSSGLLPQARNGNSAATSTSAAAATASDPRLQLKQHQQQQQSHHQQQQLMLRQTHSLSAMPGAGAVHSHDGSRIPSSNDAGAPGPTGFGGQMGGGDGLGSLHRGGAATMAAIPEAGDSWYGADDIDAALDMLMEESGSRSLYHAGSNTGSLERICFKLHNLHPRELPSDLMGAMGSWLAAARSELVQGAVRPGCTQLILDVYVSRPRPDDVEAGGDDAEAPVAPTGGAAYRDTGPATQPPQVAPATRAAGLTSRDTIRMAAAAEIVKAQSSNGDKTRVLSRLLPSESELASLEAAAAAAGAEALGPFEESSCRKAAQSIFPRTSAEAGGSGSGYGCSVSSGAHAGGAAPHLGAYVMNQGNVRAAAAAFKKLLGPRAVQSMSVSINHQMLTINGRDMGRYVADVRGTVAGLDTPLLLSVAPLAVVAGSRAEVMVVGSHLEGPGRRPQVRCQGTHVSCNIVPAPSGNFQKVRPYATPALVSQLMSVSLSGSHRAEAASDCTAVLLHVQPVESGLMMMEWEADRATGGVAISEWLPVLAVPTAAMAVEINKHAMGKESDDTRLRGFLTDLGLVLDYVTRIHQYVLLPISLLMRGDQGEMDMEVDGGDCDGDGRVLELEDMIAMVAGRDAPGAGGSSSNSAGAAGDNVEESAWATRSGGGGADQRMSPTPDSSADVPVVEHDSCSELMARPRLSRKHYNRIAALAPGLLAFAADSGMPEVMSFLMDVMLEHIHFGDLGAVFNSVESVGGVAGLPLLHRAVRSGNTRAVRLLLIRAASHGLACNLAQPAGPYHITPLHLAALQPIQVGMLQACGCGDPGVAQLWFTVQDAAGRTPAMYLRRQLERSARAAHSSSTSMRVVAAAAAAVIHPTAHQGSRSSTSGSTAYRSWGSDDPVDAAVAAAVAVGCPVPSADMAWSGEGTEMAADSIPDDHPEAGGRGRGAPGNGDSRGGSRDGMDGGSRSGAGDEPGRRPMSVDEDGERLELVRRGRRLVPQLAEGEVYGSASHQVGRGGGGVAALTAATAVALGSADLDMALLSMGRDSAGGGGMTPRRMHETVRRPPPPPSSPTARTQEEEHLSGCRDIPATEAAGDSATIPTPEQGNGQAPPQVFPPVACGGAETRGSWWMVPEPAGATATEAWMPTEMALAPEGPVAAATTAVEEEEEDRLARLAEEEEAKARGAVGLAPCCDSALVYGKSEAENDDSSGVEDVDWEQLRLELLSGRKAQEPGYCQQHHQLYQLQQQQQHQGSQPGLELQGHQQQQRAEEDRMNEGDGPRSPQLVASVPPPRREAAPGSACPEEPPTPTLATHSPSAACEAMEMDMGSLWRVARSVRAALGLVGPSQVVVAFLVATVALLIGCALTVQSDAAAAAVGAART